MCVNLVQNDEGRHRVADLKSFSLNTEGDYLEFRCEECGKQLYVKYLGFDTTVAHFRMSCTACKITNEWKVSPFHWSGLPATSA